MKKNSLLILFVLLTLQVNYVNAQEIPKDLIGRLQGTWSMTKYQSKIKTQSANGKITFSSDGGFVSEGVYFGTKKGLFSTNENRSTVIIETDEGNTEWMASVKNGVLRLRTPSGTTQPKVYMVFKKIKV